MLHEPPYTEPYVRWCGGTAGVIPPPTRFKTQHLVDISGDGNYILFGSSVDLTGDNQLAEHSLFWASADGTVIQQQLRSDPIPAGTTQITDRSYLNFDGSEILIDTWKNYSPDVSSTSKKLFLMTRQ